MKDALVICTRNRTEYVADRLRELLNFSSLPELVLIVDSSDSLETFNVVNSCKEKFNSVLIIIRTSTGLPLQRNAGLKYLFESNQQRYPNIIHFLDDDVSVEPDYFSTITELFASAPEIDVFGGFDLFLNESSYKGLLRRATLLGSSRNGVVLKSGITIPPFPKNAIDEVDWLPGLSQSFRGKIFESIEFDSEIKLYGEDIEFYLRLREYGRVACSKLLPVKHLRAEVGRDAIRAITMHSDDLCWSLAEKFPKYVNKGAVILSTFVLLIGELWMGLIARKKDSLQRFLGHLDFYKGILWTRKLRVEISIDNDRRLNL